MIVQCEIINYIVPSETFMLKERRSISRKIDGLRVLASNAVRPMGPKDGR